MSWCRLVGMVLIAATLSGCAAGPAMPGGPSGALLPLRQAWVDGRLVAYVTTDVSDAAMARAMGANHVPRLALTLPSAGTSGTPARSALERVYAFADGAQISVFASAPQPAGADNADPAYSPLWRVVEVRWAPGRARRDLTSEEAVLAAADRGDVVLQLTGVVANCPVVQSADGTLLRDARIVGGS